MLGYNYEKGGIIKEAMKILLYQWKAYSNKYLYKNLIKQGHVVTVWKDDAIIDEEEASYEKICQEIYKGYDLILSYNYFKLLALASNLNNIPYFSWTQDSPMLSLYDATTYLKTNYFFCFDSEQYEGMLARGIQNVYYFPLATDVEELSKAAQIYSAIDKMKYSADISFVGSLYSERNMFSQLNGLPAYIKGYFDGIIESQMRIPMLRFSELSIETNVINVLKQILVFHDTDESVIKYEQLIDNLVDRQVTVLERRKMIQELAQIADFKLYTTSDTSKYPMVHNCGTVDYYTEMPKVFRLSKVNINVSLRSIRTGIPLRILDVIAAGGFLLTNAQPDLFLYFEEGENIVTFQNLDEMQEKVRYYLSHDAERYTIMEKGKKIIKEQFDFSVKLPQMFEMAGLS